MLDYQHRGLLAAKHHTQLRRPDGQGVFYEECFTFDGFDGPYSILYHAFPTTDDVALTASKRGWRAPVEASPNDGALKRRLFQTQSLPRGGTMLDARVPMLFNDDLIVLFARPSKSDDVYFSNGDGDEIAYIFEGSGRLETSFGWLSFKTGDYVWIPKGCIHRWHLEGENHHVMFFETRSHFRVPKQFRNGAGQLTMEAPYSHRDFVRPEGFAWTLDQGRGGSHTIAFKKRGTFSERTMDHHPLDIVGWDGTVYPVTFSIDKYQPKTGLVHQPPTSHITFASEGFIICSFVPRIVDFHPDAIPCPYPHTSVDCDEIILYVKGNFTSRKGVGPGSLSLHPAGIPHGPHPGAYEKSIGLQRTDELAVMVDTFKPLKATANAWTVETEEYHSSWAPR